MPNNVSTLRHRDDRTLHCGDSERPDELRIWNDAAAKEAYERYRHDRAPFVPVFRSIVHRVATQFFPHCTDAIEIGCGDGQLREWLPSWLQDRTLHTDISLPGLSACRDRHPNAALAHGSAYNLPVTDASKNLVCGLGTIDSLLDGPRAVAECKRVLRPGGKVCFVADMRHNSAVLHHEHRLRDEVLFRNPWFSLESLTDGTGWSAPEAAFHPRCDYVCCPRISLERALKQGGKNIPIEQKNALRAYLDFYAGTEDPHELHLQLLDSFAACARTAAICVRNLLMQSDYKSPLLLPLRPVSSTQALITRCDELLQGWTIEENAFVYDACVLPRTKNVAYATSILQGTTMHPRLPFHTSKPALPGIIRDVRSVLSAIERTSLHSLENPHMVAEAAMHVCVASRPLQ